MKRYVSQFAAFAALVLVMLMSFTATSWAAGTATGDDFSAIDLLRPIWDAFRGGHQVAAGALAVVALIALAKRYAGKLSPKLEAFLHGDAGGTIATFLAATAGSVAAATSGDAPWAWSIMWTAGGIGIAAIGGYVALRRLVIDPIKASKWYANAPAWAKLALGVLFWIADKPDAIAEAEKAGADAVKANPAPGTDAAGPFTKF